MRTGSPRVRGRRGLSLVLSAVSLTALIGVGAIAIDLGMLYKARADALHAAEAGALAGASAFLGFRDFSAVSAAAEDTAEARARDYATRNGILGELVTQDEVQVEVQGQKVTVRVGREAIGTWFARVLGSDEVAVAARAAAAPEEGDAATCVSPLTIPDLWNEQQQDANGNRLEDGNERWTFQENGCNRDVYTVWNPPGNGQTGYGSNFRNSARDPSGYLPTGDFGRRITIRPQTPQQMNGPNNFNFWRFNGSGGPGLEDRLEECDGRAVGVGENYRVVTNNVPSIVDEIRDLINDDPQARWNNNNSTIRNSEFSDWQSSPRVIKVALSDPSDIGNNQVEFTNIGLFFLESVTNQNEITGRFMYYVNGSGGDDQAGGGSLIKHVRLVE